MSMEPSMEITHFEDDSAKAGDGSGVDEMPDTDASTPFRRWCTCLLLAMVAVGIPLAFLRPERAMEAMRYLGPGVALLLTGACLNGHLGRRGLVAGVSLLGLPLTLAYFVERSARRALGYPGLDPGGPYDLANVAVIAVVSVLFLLARGRLEGRSGGGSRWVAMLAKFDYPRRGRGTSAVPGKDGRR